MKHGLHGPGILLEKLLGPWKLLENDFLLENSLNLKKQCLNFMKKSLNTWGYSKISSFDIKRLKRLRWHLTSVEKLIFSKTVKLFIAGQFSVSYSKYLGNRSFIWVSKVYCTIGSGNLIPSKKAGWLHLKLTGKRPCVNAAIEWSQGADLGGGCRDAHPTPSLRWPSAF